MSGGSGAQKDRLGGLHLLRFNTEGSKIDLSPRER
jgi:hypothetical protein